jgi:hypothetical protein
MNANSHRSSSVTELETEVPRCDTILRLLRLPAEIQLGIRNRQLTMGHAKNLVNIENPKDPDRSNIIAFIDNEPVGAAGRGNWCVRFSQRRKRIRTRWKEGKS